jgi:hypothetical protein
MKKTFGRLLICIVSAQLGFACAKPNYQEPTVPVSQLSPAPPAQQETAPGSADKPQEEEGSGYFLKFEKFGTKLNMKWESLPTEKATGSLLLQFQDLPEDLKPYVFLWMPSMGHGSTPIKIQTISTDLFRAEKVFFVMPGEWEIHVQLKDLTGVVDEAIQKISI